MGGVVGRREYPHASYPIKLAAMNWGEGITVDARRASVSPAMPCTEKTRELVELINEAARLEGFEAGWVGRRRFRRQSHSPSRHSRR